MKISIHNRLKIDFRAIIQQRSSLLMVANYLAIYSVGRYARWRYTRDVR